MNTDKQDEFSSMSAHIAALKYTLLSAINTRRAVSFAIRFECSTDETTFDEYLSLIDRRSDREYRTIQANTGQDTGQ